MYDTMMYEWVQVNVEWPFCPPIHCSFSLPCCYCCLSRMGLVHLMREQFVLTQAVGPFLALIGAEFLLTHGPSSTTTCYLDQHMGHVIGLCIGWPQMFIWSAIETKPTGCWFEHLWAQGILSAIRTKLKPANWPKTLYIILRLNQILFPFDLHLLRVHNKFGEKLIVTNLVRTDDPHQET